MRKGGAGPLMWIILGVMVLLAIIIVLISMRDKSFGIIDAIRGMLS